MSLIQHLSTPLLDIASLAGVPMHHLHDLYPLPPKLSSIRLDPDLNNGSPDYKFEAHHLTSDGSVIYVLDPALAGKLWDM